MEDQDKRARALLLWVNSISLAASTDGPGSPAALSPTKRLRQSSGSPLPSATVSSILDLADGQTLSAILHSIDPDFFTRQDAISNGTTEHSLARKHALMAVYDLISRYFRNVMQASIQHLPPPDLQTIAKKAPAPKAQQEMCKLVSLVLCVAVQSDRNHEHIDQLQKLDESAQEELMKVISDFNDIVDVPDVNVTNGHERDQAQEAQADRNMLQHVYEDLMAQYSKLSQQHEALLRSSEASQSAAMGRDDSQQSSSTSSSNTADEREHLLSEIDRLKTDLRKTEDELGEAESQVNQQKSRLVELESKNAELLPKAEEADKLKDEIDEYRHDADRLIKAETAIEKYKKKLEEASDLRKEMNSLEEQNITLVDRNAILEEEFNKSASYRSLIDSYKSQITDLDTRLAASSSANEKLEFDFSKAQERLSTLEKENAQNTETVALYEERLKEADLDPAKAKAQTNGAKHPLADSTDDEDDGAPHLANAIRPESMTDLRIQIRRLERQLKDTTQSQADSSRIVVLDNLLEDANNMKRRYEQDYLRERKERLSLQNKLEEIRSGKNDNSTSAEVAIALRQRLNETIEEAELAKEKLSDAEMQLEKLTKEVTIARSDLQLVNKDQVDMLASLRARLEEQLVAAAETSRAQDRTINKLLLDKIDLQSDSIGQRERMLERERHMSDLKASLGKEGLSDTNREMLDQMQTEQQSLYQHIQELEARLEKAKTFIRQQDTLARDKYGSKIHADPAQDEHVVTLRAELETLKRGQQEAEQQTRIEQEQMLLAWQQLGLRNFKQDALQSKLPQGGASWLDSHRHRTLRGTG